MLQSCSRTSLNLYRRHFRTAKKCVGGYPPDFPNYKSDELRRSYKKRYCPIYADGTLRGRFKRKNTRQGDWAEAKAVAAQWEDTGRWEKAPPHPKWRSSCRRCAKRAPIRAR